MNCVSHPWIALRASCALVALLLAAPGCGDDGSGTDTDDKTTTSGPGTTSSGTDPTSSGTDPTTGGGGGMLSHAVDIQPIWDANCVSGCHEPGGTGSPWFSLTSDVAYDSIVNKPALANAMLTLVTPGDPSASYLLNKLNNTQSDVGGGTSPMPMPEGMNAFMMLPGADIDKITDWIEQGAKP